MSTESEINALRRYLDGDEQNILERVLAGFHNATEMLYQLERAANDVAGGLRILAPEWAPSPAGITDEMTRAAYQRDIDQYTRLKQDLERLLRDNYISYYNTVNRYNQAYNFARSTGNIVWRMRADSYSRQLATMKLEQEGYKSRIASIAQTISRIQALLAAPSLSPRAQIERNALTMFQQMSSTMVEELPKVDTAITSMQTELTLLSVFRVRLSIQGIDPIALIAPLFDWDFMPVSLEGEVSDDKDSFKGKATLKAPLSLTLDPLSAKLKPGSFVIKFGVPESAGFAQSFQQTASTKLGAFWPLVQQQTALITDLLSNPTIILSNKDGSDSQFGSYLSGFNLFSKVDIARVGGVVDLLGFVNSLNITLPSKTAIVGLGIADARRMLSVKLPLNIQMLSSMFVLRSLYFSIIADNTNAAPIVRCGIEFDVNLDGKAMQFVGAFEKNDTGGSVWGAWDGVWRDPFGFKGIELTSIGAEYTVGSKYPAVRGSASLYGLDVQGNFGIKIDETSALKTIVVVSFNRSFNIFDLAKAIARYTGPRPSLIEMRDVNIYLAPQGGTIAGKSYKPGMTVAGTGSLFGRFEGTLDLSLSLKLGLDGSFKLNPWSLSVGGFEFIKLGAFDARISLPPFEGIPSLGFGVSLSLFNGLLVLPKVDFNLDFEDLKLEMPPLPGSGDFLVDVAVAIDANKVEIGFAPKASLSVDVFGQRLDVSVSSTVRTVITGATAITTQLTFSFDVLGVALNLGPITVNQAVTNIEQLTSIFGGQALGVIKKTLTDTLSSDPGAMCKWAAATIGQLATQGLKFVADFAKQTGVALTAGLTSAAQEVFGLNLDQVGSMFREAGFDAKSVVTAADSVLSRAASIAADAFPSEKGFLQMTYYRYYGHSLPWEQLEGVLLVQEYGRYLQACGFPTTEWAPALPNVSAGYVALGLKNLTTTAQIGDILANGLALKPEDVVSAMGTLAGYAVTDVSNVLQQNFSLTNQAIATTFKAAGYGVETVGNLLRDLGEPGEAVAKVLKVAGYGIDAVGGYAEDVLGYTGDALNTVLEGAGYVAEEISGFFENAVDLINPSNW